MRASVPAGTPPAIRRHNRSAVLRVIRERGPISRLDISQDTALTPATVTHIMSELIAEGYVAEVGYGSSSAAGRRPILTDLVPHAILVAGVDIRPAGVTIALADVRANVLARSALPLLQNPDPIKTLDSIAEQIRNLVAAQQCTLSDLRGVGVGTVGLVDSVTGVNLYAASLSWQGVAIASELTSRLGVPVVVDNNVRTIAVAERLFGLGQHVADLLVMYVGSGIGSGLVIGREVFRSNKHYAGEIGHMIVAPGGQKCSCGSYGCLDTVASGRVLLARARTLAAQHPDSALAQLEASAGLTIENVMRAADSGDELAHTIVCEATEYLGLALANLVNVLNPELVVLAGPIIHGGATVTECVRSVVQRHSYVVRTMGIPSITVTSFGEQAAIRGAASLALDRFFYNPEENNSSSTRS
jgi:N-acetylglucosamine repressor